MTTTEGGIAFTSHSSSRINSTGLGTSIITTCDCGSWWVVSTGSGATGGSSRNSFTGVVSIQSTRVPPPGVPIG